MDQVPVQHVCRLLLLAEQGDWCVRMGRPQPKGPPYRTTTGICCVDFSSGGLNFCWNAASAPAAASKQREFERPAATVAQQWCANSHARAPLCCWLHHLSRCSAAAAPASTLFGPTHASDVDAESADRADRWTNGPFDCDAAAAATHAATHPAAAAAPACTLAAAAAAAAAAALNDAAAAAAAATRRWVLWVDDAMPPCHSPFPRGVCFQIHRWIVR